MSDVLKSQTFFLYGRPDLLLGHSFALYPHGADATGAVQKARWDSVNQSLVLHIIKDQDLRQKRTLTPWKVAIEYYGLRSDDSGGR
ncbi:hypothetical protein Dda_7067 [Drechslerella dactyloides]|uniref:Uncharacterized protein n=1 Tax=Drechslerella dactyloides TaxID=74499 RepID=A0AAD6IV34_DREDA|nr:hypothetical protein Dda_7067 [Drechslerella dactyloides]